MLDIIKILSEEFIAHLCRGYRSAFCDIHPDYEGQIRKNADQVIRIIAGSNTLYHNFEHTIQVTLVGQALLQGKLKAENNSITPEIWLNFIMSLLCHDIGYVSDLDLANEPVSKIDNNASDAVLMSVHIDRGKRFVEESFSQQNGIDIEFIQDCIERTRFPIPEIGGYQCTDDFPGLVRGADLIGQLSDPRYLNKLPAVFYEFEENGYNEVTGYKQPGDLLSGYVDFYSKSVAPYVGETLQYLSMTSEGREIIRSHEANMAKVEENIHRFQENLSVGSRHS